MDDLDDGLPGMARSPSTRRFAASTHVATVMTNIVALVVALDQVTKYVMAYWLGPTATAHRWDLVHPWIAFEYVENTGAAFGLLAGRTWLLSIAVLAIAGWFIMSYGRVLPSHRIMRIAVGLILGGAFGNLIDRLRLGYVVDFVAIGIWPRFNVADSAISLGLIVLLVCVWRGDVNESKAV